MNEFLAWLGLVCVLPFILAMLELRFKESRPSQKATRGNLSGTGSPSLIIGFTTECRGQELVRVVRATGLTARWNDRSSF
jgi:hypothetical protein